MAIIVLLAFRPTFLMFIEYPFLLHVFYFFFFVYLTFKPLFFLTPVAFVTIFFFFRRFLHHANQTLSTTPSHANSIIRILCLTPYGIWNCNLYCNNVLIYDISPTDVILRLNITKKKHSIKKILEAYELY